MRAANSSAPDILIVSTSTAAQAAYWQRRLRGATALGLAPATAVCCVAEEWPGGAGTGLGTLLAFEKAWTLLRQRGTDLMVALRDGAAVAMVHTAGQGTRLAPLTLTENNNKSAVALPAYYSVAGECRPLTILEAVIKQICEGGALPGRLGVFWGDQLFQSGGAMPLGGSGAHIAVAAQWRSIPTPEQWHSAHLDRYGIIAIGGDGSFSHLEKVGYEALIRWRDSHPKKAAAMAINLGSFSLSAACCAALLDEFGGELRGGTAKMDIEPYVWMTLTLDEGSYLELMGRRGVEQGVALRHYGRMEGVRRRLLDNGAAVPLYWAEDVGAAAHWWDFGTLSAYYGNLLEMAKPTQRGAALRRFLQVEEGAAGSFDGCLVLNSRLGGGRAVNSVLIDVAVDELDVENVVAIGVTASSLRGRDALAYKVDCEGPLLLEEGEVSTEVLVGATQRRYPMHTLLQRDGKADWEVTLPHNPCSYAALQELLFTEQNAAKA